MCDYHLSNDTLVCVFILLTLQSFSSQTLIAQQVLSKAEPRSPSDTSPIESLGCRHLNARLKVTRL